MNEWKPSSDNKWMSTGYVRAVNRWLNLNYIDLLNENERMLAIGSFGESLDDYGNLLERWIRKRLRMWSGGDVSEFVRTHPNLITGAWRTDYYLQDIFRVICNDLEVQTYLRPLGEHSPTEQVARIIEFLRHHPALKKSHFTIKEAFGPTATIIYHKGLAEVLLCKDGENSP
ncbi:MAG: hypothetical protein LCI00_23360 [Chloroflexi bacterium]|nr:hypothetical protein [Chloroflexota bacterium]MCC6895993.1 hypothetical protein [Anaerolineae bacterium]